MFFLPIGISFFFFPCDTRNNKAKEWEDEIYANRASN